MGNYDIVQLLTELDIVDVNVVESNHCSALMIACMHGYCEVAERLLDRADCDVSIVSNSGYTCLVTACYKNHPSIVARLLVRQDVDPNWVSKEGDSLMMTCCARSYNDIIRLLAARSDLNVNHTGVRHLSPLMLACIEANREAVRAILARQDVDVNIIGKDGVTAIGLACLQGDLEIVKMLLKCPGVNINNMTVDGVTPFTVSIFKGHLDITRLLLQRPELELGSSQGGEEREIDPLHVAAAKGQLDIVVKLIRFGVEIDRSRPGSHTAIPVTMMKCRNPAVMINIILSLIEAGCHPTVDNVRLAIRKAPQVGVEVEVKPRGLVLIFCVFQLQEILFEAALTPLSLMKQARKALWRTFRQHSGGRNIGPLLQQLINEIPDSLLNYLLFNYVITNTVTTRDDDQNSLI